MTIFVILAQHFIPAAWAFPLKNTEAMGLFKMN